MKKSFLFLIAMVFSMMSWGQIAVTVSGTAVTSPALASSYTSLANALTALNAVSSYTTPGTIIFTCAAGGSETAPVKGFIVGSSTLNPLLSATNTVTIIKASGTVTINAGVGTSLGPTATPDGMLYLNGADYVTIDGLTFTDGNSTNATVAMEYGIAFFKRAAGDGCNNNTIQNCTFNMQRINNSTGSGPMFDGSWAIEVMNSTAAAATTALTPTNGGTLATNGTNSANKFYTNAINNGNGGIGLSGYAATLGVGPTPTATTFLGDLGNDVGGVLPGTGNSILNFGGGAATNASAGIRANNQWSVNISYNTVNNNNGSGVNHTTTLRGIYAQAGTSANATINNNSVTIKSGATTSALTAIENAIGSTAASNTVNINNNIITGSYTTATTGVCYGIYNTATPATVNINSNTISGITYSNAGITGSGVFYGIFNSGAATTVNVTSNKVYDLSRVGTTGGTTIGIYVSGGTTQNVNNDTVYNLSIDGSGTACIMYGIQTTGTTVSCNLNIVHDLSCIKTSGTSAMYGIYNFGSPTNENFNYNQIYNLTHNGTGIVYGLYTNTAAGTRTVTGNTIYAISGAGTTIAGMLMATSTPTVSKNRIYNIQSTSSGSPVVSGLIVSSVGTTGTAATILNNLIGDLNAPNANSASGADNIRGINLTSTTASTNINVYYNTVYLNATSTGTNFSTSGIYHAASATASTAALTLRNNIIFNTSTPNGTGVTAAYRRSATNLANYTSASNNNLFYAGTPSATMLLFVEGTTTLTNPQENLSGYKTYVGGGRDIFSVNEDPVFQSTTGSSADFLKYDLGASLQLESGAVNIAPITDDFTGTIRQGNGGYAGTGTAPDMGAWELEGTPSDVTGPGISYSAILNKSCLADVTLSGVVISDGSSVNITAGTRPRMYFKKSTNSNTYVDNTNATDGWKYVEAIGAGGSPFSFTTNYSLLNGGAVVAGDNIQYFIVAQDIAGTPNVSINNGTFTGTPTDVNLSGNFPINGSINSYTLTTGLSGTKTIGATGDYTSLTGAGGLFEDINTRGISAALTVTIMDASVTEAGTNALNAINYSGCAAGPYALTIKPNSVATLTGSVAAGAVIKLNGADYVTIDGSNSGGSDRSLTIKNTTTTTSGNAVIWLAAPASGNGSTNNTVKNCIIEGNSSTTSFLGMYVGGNATVSLTAAGNEQNSNNTINNNLFRKTINGLALFGFSATAPDMNNAITNNNFGTAVAGEGFSLIAINTDRQSGLVVSGNEIQNVTNSTSTSLFGGIRLLDFKNGLCYNNKIHDISYTGTSTPKLYGIAVTSSTYTTVGNPSNAQVYNNIVYKLNSTGISSVWNLTGILASAGYGDKFYFNSVHLTGQLANTTSGLAAAFANGDGNITSVCSNIDVRNNSFSLTGSNGSTGGNFWAYYTKATTLTGSTLNYNDLYCNGTGATNNVGQFNSINYTTLTAWQTATGQDANSIAVDPLYTSTSILIPQLGSPLAGAGVAGTGVLTDISGVTRSTGTAPTGPSIGAYENAADLINPVITYTALINTLSTTNRNLAAVSVTDAASALSPDKPRLYYKKSTDANTLSGNTSADNGWKYVESNGTTSPFDFTIDYSLLQTGTVSAGDAIQYFIVAADAASTPNVEINSGVFASIPATVALTSAAFPITGTINQYLISAPFTGTYTVPGSYPTLTGAGGFFAAINAGVVTGNITVNITADLTEDGTNALNQWLEDGGTASYTLTIQPDAATLRTISGTAATGLIRLNGADRLTIDGRYSGVGNYITINNTNTTSPALLFINDACNNTIQYTNITGRNTTLAGGVVLFSTTTGTTGNDNNTISYCNIGADGTNYPASLIYSLGTSLKENSGNTVSYCNLSDFWYVGASSSYGIGISSNSTDWTISNNSIYQTATRTATGAATPTGIYINNTSGVNFQITGNYIGGGALNCGGSAWTVNGAFANKFLGIYLNVGTTTASSVQNNTISNIDFSTTSGTISGTGSCGGIYVAAGNVNIGNVTGNTIGSASVDNIKLTSTVAALLVGISSASTGTVNISNNTIYGLTSIGSSATVGSYCKGILVTGTAGNYTIINNIIGSTTVANSLRSGVAATTTAATYCTGIENSASGTINITSNTIGNLTSYGSNTSTIIRGILSSSGTNTITQNLIRDLYTASANTGINTAACVNGISFTSTTTGTLISQNTIYNLMNTHATVSGRLVGIAYSGSTTGTNIVERNFIYDLDVTSPNCWVVGIDMAAGLTTYKNNIIRLGTNGTVATLATAVVGINENVSTPTNNLYFNSVFIGGTTSGTLTSQCFNNAITPGSARSVKNNIFYNARSSGGLGNQYAIRLSVMTNTTVNNNDYYVTGTLGFVGMLGANSHLDLAAWQTATGQDANSLSSDPSFIDATATTPNLHITEVGISNPNPLESSGTAISGITNDFDNEARPRLSPSPVNGGGFGVDIGADEFDGYNANVCTGTPTAGTATGTTSFCVSGTPTITAGGYSVGIGFAYQWQSSVDLAFASPVDISGQTNPASLNAGTVTSTTYYRLKVTCLNSSLSDYTSTVTITVYANPVVAVSPSSTTFCVGGSQLLTASGADTYSWAPATGLSATTGTAVGATPTATITYTVTGLETATGCSNTATATITVNPIPTSVTAAATSNAICIGATIDLTSSAVSNGFTTATLIDPTTDGGFETGSSFALNNWTVVNSANNNWIIGNLAPAYAGTQGAHISLNGSAYDYSPTSVLSNTSHFYRDVIIPAGSSNISLSFYWKGFGETDWDNLLIWTAPTTVTPVVDLPASASGIPTMTGATLVWTQPNATQSVYELANVTLPNSLAGTTVRLIFTWQNDLADGVSPPAAIDNISLTALSPAAPTYSWSSSPSGFTSALQNPTGVTPTVTTQYIVTVQNNLGCTTTNTTTVTVDPVTVAGSVTAAANPILGGQTATLTLSGQTGSIIGWEQSRDDNTWTYYSVYTNPYTPTPNELGNWYYRAKVQSGSGCATLYSTSANVFVNVNSTTFTQTTDNDWNTGSNWDNGIPTKLYNAIIPNNKHANLGNSGLACNNLTVAPKGELTMVDENFTIFGTLTMQSDATGTASIKETGTITYSNPTLAQRYIDHDNYWHLLSSPMSNQAIKPNFAPTSCDMTFDFYKWDETIALSGLPWINLRLDPTTYNPAFETDFSVGRGYLVAYSPSYSGGGTTHLFSGNLNSGDKTIPITNGTNNYNLIGNPYQSALDWDHGNFVINYTATLGATPSLWIWNQTIGNYGVYTNPTGINGVTNIIPPHQGFFVTAISTGSLTIPNISRVHPGSQNFLKTTPANMLRLKVSSTVNTYSDEIIVNFNSNATADQGAAKWFSMIATAPSLYTVKNAKNLSINTLTGVTNNLIVPVGFIAGVNGNYSITASELNSFTATTYVYLKDLKTNSIQDLNQNAAYSFAGFTSDNPDRFQLIFSLAPLGINNQTVSNANIYVYDNTLYINANEKLKQVLVYNMLGQEILNVQYPVSNTIHLNQTTGYYTVRVVTTNNVYSQKVYIK